MGENPTNQSMQNSKKKIWMLILLLILVLAAGLIFLWNSEKSPTTSLEGCGEGDIYSETTGEPCSGEPLEPCIEGELYNRDTGEPCESNI